MPARRAAPGLAGGGPAVPSGEQRAYFPELGETSLPIYRREDLAPEHPFKGPALLEDPWATTLVYPGQSAVLDPRQSLDRADVLDRPGRPRGGDVGSCR